MLIKWLSAQESFGVPFPSPPPWKVLSQSPFPLRMHDLSITDYCYIVRVKGPLGCACVTKKSEMSVEVQEET
jgi:hypothetical protein